MTNVFISLSVALASATACSQGTVNFQNNQTTLVSAGSVGQEAVIGGPPGSYYFGLLIAPPGTADPSQFSFADVYATNAAAGHLYGGSVVAVKGWGPATSMSFLVAGWSATLGHDWNQGWLSGTFGAPGYFGLSSVGTGASGGPSGGVPSIALPLFGPSGSGSIATGWNLAPVPEPSTAALGALEVAIIILFRRNREHSQAPKPFKPFERQTDTTTSLGPRPAV
jgi:hypothetical protein